MLKVPDSFVCLRVPDPEANKSAAMRPGGLAIKSSPGSHGNQGRAVTSVG